MGAHPPRAWGPSSGPPHLQLCGGQVDICDHFSARMLHLQAWVQLQEMEAAVLAVQIFHCTGTHVTHGLGQEDSTLQRQTGAKGFQPLWGEWQLPPQVHSGELPLGSPDQ